MSEEILEIVDKGGKVLGTAPRSVIHGNPDLMHRVVHVLVFNASGALLLQKRSMLKDVAAGKWDTSVGGHVSPGEEMEKAAEREMKEELGVSCPVEFLYTYVHSNPYETELVYTYKAVHEGSVSFDAEEIDEVRPWSLDEIKQHLGDGSLSDNFEHGIRTYMAHAGIE
jgi:isopentenyldiphosphate isomerase